MDASVSSDWVLALAAVLAIGGLIVLAAAVALGVSFVRANAAGGRGGGTTPEKVLDELGYERIDPGHWRLRLQREELHFHDEGADGLRWSVQLPRYNTLTLQVEERSRAPANMVGSLFESRQPALDQRFVFSSVLPAQTLALIMEPRVGHAMLAVPVLSLLLKGDELVIRDADGACAKAKGPAEMHRAMVTLVVAVLGTLYSKASGTLLPEHR